MIVQVRTHRYRKSELSRDHGDLCRAVVVEADRDQNRFELSLASREKFATVLDSLRDRWTLRPLHGKPSMKFLYTVDLAWADGERHSLQLCSSAILGPDAYAHLSPAEAAIIAECLGDARLQFKDYPWNAVQPRPMDRME